ncbi:glycosyltransferase family 4 protein [Methylibium sp.]|uniref:glycosyltransferase family 4 protein n=1 Tax=Methylibium sp. TaxID=2067992 RepID=UPI003D0BB6CD
MENPPALPGQKRTRVAIVINCPAPYRNPVFEVMARDPAIELHVIFCSALEPIRQWDIASSEFSHEYLTEHFTMLHDKVVHINPDVWSALRRFKPDVVITTGFNPTYLFAYLYCRLHKIHHVPWTDGTAISETTLTRVHKWLRRHIYPRSSTFVGASNGSTELYRLYGIPEELIFKARLCANNEIFFAAPPVEKQYDFIFSGRFAEVKNPLFALEVVSAVSRRLGRRASIAFIGAGALEAEMRSTAAAKDVDAHFLGFARQADLPTRYAAAKILLFPTLWDPWGIVANEACAARVPVMVTPVAGVAGELIMDQINGYVLPLDVTAWAEAATHLLQDAALYERFAAAARQEIAAYTYDSAAGEILRAIQRAARAWTQEGLGDTLPAAQPNNRGI